MGRSSYNGGSLIVRAIGWCATNATFSKNRPSIRLGQHSKKWSAALAAKKAAAKQEQDRDKLEGLSRADKKAAVLREYATFADYEQALSADSKLASRHGFGSSGKKARSK